MPPHAASPPAVEYALPDTEADAGGAGRRGEAQPVHACATRVYRAPSRQFSIAGDVMFHAPYSYR